MPLQIVRQDITKMHVNAIVNTTDENMVGHSGVDLAIHEGAGPMLDAECKRLAPLGLGMAKLTKGYNLDAKYIIHTSVPSCHGENSDEKNILKSCYVESLKLAVESGCESVAFPLISFGDYGCPKDQVLKIAIKIITEFLLDNELTVYLCVFDRTSYEFSKTLFLKIKSYIESDDGQEQEYEFNDMLPDIDEHSLCESNMIPSCDLKLKSVETKSLKDYLMELDKPFAYRLFDLIDESGMTDVECYKKANIDKKTFSKIKCHPQTYKPSKQTAVAFAIALRLNMEQTQDFLACAGLALSRSFTFDKIICYCIQNEIYDIFEINEALFEFDQPLLGSL